MHLAFVEPKCNRCLRLFSPAAANKFCPLCAAGGQTRNDHSCIQAADGDLSAWEKEKKAAASQMLIQINLVKKLFAEMAKR